MYLVYGLQKSGISIIKLLQKKNQPFRIWDDNIDVRNKLKKKLNDKIFLKPNKNNLINFEKIYVSPGISLRQKKFNIKIKSSKLQRDLNLYFSNINNQKIIAITGTNGKSTTTKLIGDLLKKNNKKTFVGGNIGMPLCDAITNKREYSYHVVELSSFQLETAKNLNTEISILTNIANDHLDRYKNMTDYISQKKKIISKTGINIISIDDKYSKNIYLQKKIKNKICFSILDKAADIYMGEKYILDNYFKNNKKIYLKKISKDLEGHFNNQNIIITYICCKLLKISEKTFQNIIKNFKGLPYRSHIIYESKFLKIINNSKSTNINSTINSIKNYDKIFLILGGIAKEKNFEIIKKYKKKIVSVYAFGKSSSLIQNKLKKYLEVKSFKDLETLVINVFKDIKKNNFKSTILFAPACSSYDQYKNFEERGMHFNKLIKEKIFK